VGLGVAAGAALVTRLEQRPSPSRIQLRLAGRRGASGRAMVTGVGAGVAAGALFGAAFWLAGGTIGALGLGLLAGLVAGLAGGLGVGLVAALRVPIEQTHVVSPRSLLRADRAGALVQSLLGGAASALTTGLVAAVVARPGTRGGVGLVAGLGVGAAVGLVVLCNSAWGRWELSRAWLALTGHVPWSLMGFLEDGHARGILRQAGGVYEFRHTLLQQQLAEST
jgi:hypothetical protein